MAQITSNDQRYSGVNSGSHLDSLFKSLSRDLYPDDMGGVLEWSEELWYHGGLYSQAIQKAVRYFMTELDIIGEEDLDFDDQLAYQKILQDDYNILSDLSLIGDDFIGFGNSFTSIHFPFIRSLVCPTCGANAPLSELKKLVTFKDWEFVGQCWSTDNCKYKGVFIIQDDKIPGAKAKPKIIRWPPQAMEINYEPTSGSFQYTLDLTELPNFIEKAKAGDALFIENLPQEIMEALAEENLKFKFNTQDIFHMRNESIAYKDLSLKGWGLPRFMSEFETAILITLLDKHVEAIIADYLIPFRVLSPPSTGKSSGSLDIGGGDILATMDGRNFVSNVKTMIERHRRNPTDWNFLPSAIQYQTFGGEASNLVPVELMEHFEARLLRNIGIPEEFYSSGSGQGNAIATVVGFRMFEKTWDYLVVELNNWLNWYVGLVGGEYSWPDFTTKLIPISMYEDDALKQMKMEMMASGMISETTGFRALGLNREYEKKQQIMEQLVDEEMNIKFSKKLEDSDITTQAMRVPSAGERVLMEEEQAAMAAEEQAGGATGGQPGQPMPPGQSMQQGPIAVPPAGSGGSKSIDALLYEAEDISRQLMQMDPTARHQQLLQLKQTNEVLHAQVKSKLEQLENQAAQQGLNMTRQGQIPMPPPVQ